MAKLKNIFLNKTKDNRKIPQTTKSFCHFNQKDWDKYLENFKLSEIKNNEGYTQPSHPETSVRGKNTILVE